MTAGTTARLTATGNLANGTTTDLTTLVTWTSAASGVASVATNTGVVTGNQVGTTSITATINNGAAYGGVFSAVGSITVTVATLTGFTITPPTMSVAKGSSTTFTATGTFTDATTGNVSGSVSWASSDPAVATIDASGIATGVSAGSCTITVSSGGISNVATLTVF